jgi:16S rRNA (cytidine1402-2'-O)-methyltransferase
MNAPQKSSDQTASPEATASPVFYIVATPIGNRGDMTTRAMQILGDVDFIVAEDTRHTGQLLAYMGIKKPMISFRDAPRSIMDRSLKLIRERTAEKQNGAYVTDAGTPGVSDPGWRLVNSLLEVGVEIVPIPGPSAVATIASLAEIPLNEYRFVGFLPKKKGHQTKIDELQNYLKQKEPRGVILYESPNRIRRTLTDWQKAVLPLGVVIGRELTKKFETVYRGILSPELIATLPEKGEYVILIHNVTEREKI